MTTTTTPTSGAADLPEALINIAREIEALKRYCGMDPESAIAIQNGRYMAISSKIRALAAGQATAAPAQPAAQQGVTYAERPEPLSKRPSEANTLVWVADPISSTGVRGVFVDDITCLWWWGAGLIFQKEADAAALALRMRSAIASHGQAPAQADSVQEEAALWRWLAEYLVGTRTDLDDEIVASETVNDLRKLVKAAIKQGEKQ